METFAYLHTACAYEELEPAELTVNLDQLNLKQLSSQAGLLMLQLLVPVAILAVAGHASALQVGNRGPSVIALQDRLRQLHYFNYPRSTGNYASITADAVSRFQRDRNLTVDGIAGPETLRELGIQISAESGNIVPISSTSSSATAISSVNSSSASYVSSSASSISTVQSSVISTGRLLRIGSSGPDVRSVQQQLNARNYPVSVDGSFGSETYSAVRRFQADSNLHVDGIVGSETLNALGLSSLVDLGGNGPSASTRKRYVVVVPMNNSATLAKVRLYAPRAFSAPSNLGRYVYAGASDERGLAEAEATRLRAYGFDAQVRYF